MPWACLSARRLGEAVEAAFLAKATMLGIPVLKPWGDSRPYDFAVEGWRLWKVQVKPATSHRGTRCDARAAGSGELYTLDDIDFLAATRSGESVVHRSGGCLCSAGDGSFQPRAEEPGDV